MPDAAGRIPPVAFSVSSERWARIFGRDPEEQEDRSPEVARPGQWLDDQYDWIEDRGNAVVRHEGVRTRCEICGVPLWEHSGSCVTNLVGEHV